LVFSFVVISGICRFHSSLREVILVQLFLMIALFISVALPFLVNSLSTQEKYTQAGSFPAARMIHRISEDEVIAGFLKSDFHSPIYQKYQDDYGEIVNIPNFNNAADNARRKALLFLRHYALWKEIPLETEWYEMEIAESDLSKIRIFPRAQWRKLAHGNFSLTFIVEGMRIHQNMIDASLRSKIASIGDQLLHENHGFGAVILIGVNESMPLTVLDGNHRLVAAMLASPSRLKALRFVCGLSPRMAECCWYNTNVVTLLRYGRNVLAHSVRSSETELAQLLQNTE
jgi:hypothetical protein